MKENFNIVQLRSTIFLPQNIGYTPDVAKKFSSLLLPDGKIYSVTQYGVPTPGINPHVPQYGMPWRLFKSIEGKSYNIFFLPGKIDVILDLGEGIPYDCETEKEFCEESTKWFKEILRGLGGITVVRIAYAPTYANVFTDNVERTSLWGGFLKKLDYDDAQFEDINLSFLLKDHVEIKGTPIQLNLLHNIFDGIQTKTENEVPDTRKVLLFRFDLNSVPQKPLSLDADGVEDFFIQILTIKNKLVDNVKQ